MGNLLARQPGSIALLGAGRRAATLRNRVRFVRNYFSWLTATHEVLYSTSLEHVVGFLKARASEPVNGGALKNINRTFTFLHEVTATEQANRLTTTPLYDAVYREILTSCEPGTPVKQAPRFPVGLLALIENFVTTESNPAYMRMYGWWVLLQSWGTMRFSDHRGLSAADITLKDGSLTGLLRRTKTTGTDKNVSARPVRVDASSFISSPQWLSAGWQILNELVPFQRDYLLPAPAGAHDSCLRTELRYALGYVIQNRLLASLVDSKGAEVLTAEATVFWTPHSVRSFLPSCTAALGFPKEERGNLGGWSHQESDTCARTARLRISSVQKSVTNVIARGPEGDRLGEQESMIQLEEHLTKKGHDTHMVAKITKKIGEWSVRETAGENAVLTQGNLEETTEGNRGLGAEANRGLGGPRELTGEENRRLFPSGSEPRARSGTVFGRGYPGTPRQNAKSRENQEARRHAKAATRADQSNAVAWLLCL